MKNFWTEFRNFAVKGNALDLAIAVVVGNAFSGVINSLVGNIITPLLGLLTGNVDFKNLAFTVVRPVGEGTGIVVGYGLFLQAVFNFFVITLSIFIVFRIMAGARRRIFREGEKAVAPEEKPAQERLLEEIRDLLQKRR
jgi:large conductance mechanosensitive channel